MWVGLVETEADGTWIVDDGGEEVALPLRELLEVEIELRGFIQIALEDAIPTMT